MYNIIGNMNNNFNNRTIRRRIENNSVYFPFPSIDVCEYETNIDDLFVKIVRKTNEQQNDVLKLIHPDLCPIMDI